MDETIYKIGNNTLDKCQKQIVLDNSKSLLVVAGAGSGKTFTILGKIKYLVENKNIDLSEILCISLTNDTVNNLKSKLLNMSFDINVKTFHKLGLDILKKNKKSIAICSDNYLDFIIDEYFSSYIFNQKKERIKFFNYINCNYNFLKKRNYLLLKNTICTAIHLIKNNNLSFDYLIKLYKFSILDRLVLKWIIQIYQIYKNELESAGLIDFDDMIIKAANIVENDQINLGYQYIIIDEYQDTSYSRYLLIEAIRKNCSANIMVVGDDFQSIYRFTGCEVNMFINFEKYFSDANILYLENTYRNSQELITVAGDFIMKNKNQIRKKLISDKRNSKPIKIVIDTGKDILNKLVNFINKSDILILGRNNYDINKYDLKNNLRYLTIHKSKGLEAEEVILINLENKEDGLPNQKREILVLNKIKRNTIKYAFDEERRLFYVALTRTKNNIYLVVPKFNKSVFIKELIKNYNDYIEYINYNDL